MYASETSCSSCMDGYFLRNAATCDSIPANENCLQKTADLCTKCITGKILYKNICYDPPQTPLEYCTTSNKDSSPEYSNFDCSVCNQGSIPIDYKDNNWCVEESYMELFLNPTDDLLQSCAAYTIAAGKYVCGRCKDGYYYDSTRHLCLK